MFDCSSGLGQCLKNLFHFRNSYRKSSESASSDHYSIIDRSNNEKSTSTETLDSGFIELSKSSSSFSLKSILRQNVCSTTGIDPQKKVSICVPLSPKKLGGGRKGLCEMVVCNNKEELEANIPTVRNISSQINRIILTSKVKLIDQYPDLKTSIELLFEKKLEMQLTSLSSDKIAEFLYSLRVILFCPPQQQQDIIITKIIDLLLAVTKRLKLENLYEECLKMWSVYQSGKYYKNTEFYWAHTQTLMISVPVYVDSKNGNRRCWEGFHQ